MMQTKKVIDTRIKDFKSALEFSFWDEAAEEWTKADDDDETTIAPVAKKMKVSPELVKSMASYTHYLNEKLDELASDINDDLIDMWKRMDALEAKIDTLPK